MEKFPKGLALCSLHHRLAHVLGGYRVAEGFGPVQFLYADGCMGGRPCRQGRRLLCPLELWEPWMKGVGSRSPQGAVLPTGNACQPSRCPSSTCVPTGGASKMGRALGWRPPGIYLQAAHSQAHHVLNYKHKIAPGDSTCWASSVEVGKVGVGDGGEINQGQRVR